MRILIALGATEEPVDKIRFITTRSSGRMGASLGKAALHKAHEVTLVAGRTSVDLPDVKTLKVRTAGEMIHAVLNELKQGYDLFISVAAIADYSPYQEMGKLKSDQEELTLRLQRNPKLTRKVKERFPGLLVVAFKAEHDPDDGLYDSCKQKLDSEDLDLVIGNDLRRHPMGSESTSLTVVFPDGRSRSLKKKHKEDAAFDLIELIEGNLLEV